MAWIVGVLVPLYLIILLLAPLLSNPALLGSFCGHLSVVHSLLTQFDHQTLSVIADFYLSVPFIFKKKINKKKNKQTKKKSCLFWLLGDLIILIPSQFNSVLFVLSLYACTAVPLHPTARFDSLGDLVSVSHLPSASTGHVGFALFATKKCDVRVRLPSALQEFCCCLGTCSLMHHGLCTLWTAFTNIWLEFCWHWLPHSLGVMYLHLWENTFPFFPQGVFRVFVSGRYTSNQVPAHHRPKEGLRLVTIIVVLCPGKLIGCPVYFFLDLGRIHASLFRIPRCSKLMSLGLVVLLLS